MIRYATIVVVLLLVAFVPFSIQSSGLKVGSKKFTESVILGEVLTHVSRDAGLPATHYQELGGTKLVFEAMVKGDIDIYPEYSGTIHEEILAGRELEDDDQVRQILREQGILMSRPLGFNNSYALGMKRERVEELGLDAVSDLTRHPDLRFGFGSDFMDREDG
jgi:osmoprotectant transport system permease protein